MRRHSEVDEQPSIDEAQDGLERQREQITDAASTMYRNLRGSYRELDQHGNRLFMTDLPEPKELAEDQHLWIDKHMYLRTLCGTDETGQTNATLQIRRDGYGETNTRLRVTIAEVYPPYRGKGYGDAMLGAVEEQARTYGATEVYGDFAPEGDREKVRAFYERNGYLFRSYGAGEEVYKPIVANRLKQAAERSST